MRLLGSLCTALSLSACISGSDSSVTTTAPPASELLVRAQGLSELLSLRFLLLTALVIAAAFLVNLAVQRVVRVAWRLGFDTERRLAAPASMLSLCLAAFVALFVAYAVYRSAPVFAVVVSLALFGGALWTSGVLADAALGIGLIVRRPLRIGDRVIVGEHVGIVREIHLTKLELRGSDGATIIVPNRLLGRHALSIERARNTVPIEVGVELAEPSQARIRTLRRSLLLSPYRAPGTSVEVTSDPVKTRFCS
ncbi:MAG TPA: mechanosensitive ion channel domain-containing protein, partial [Polyangiaceae bacterium]|nr:mechanosensitive ion channel domain-containing protein [Polyangiaceae bacterium]